jgi:hypothetical protein
MFGRIMSKSGKSGILGEEADDEYVTIKVKKHVKERLMKMRALLEFKTAKRVGLNELLEFLIANAPEIQIPMDEFRVVSPQDEKARRT